MFMLVWQGGGINVFWEFPGSPVVRIPVIRIPNPVVRISMTRSQPLVRGTKMLQAIQCSQKQNKVYL